MNRPAAFVRRTVREDQFAHWAIFIYGFIAGIGVALVVRFCPLLQ